MEKYTTEATLTADGTVVLSGLPFHPGDALTITVVRQSDDSQPFFAADGPRNWQNANPQYWIKVACDRITENFHPEKIILFGSHARGNASNYSDIDLLVVFKEINSKQDQAIAIRKLLSDFPLSKDIVVTTVAEIEKYGHLVGSVLRPALKEGKVLYERL